MNGRSGDHGKTKKLKSQITAVF